MSEIGTQPAPDPDVAKAIPSDRPYGLDAAEADTQAHLDYLASVDKWRGRGALCAGALAAVVPLGVGWWVVDMNGDKELSVPRVLLLLAALAYSVAFLRFADRMSVPLNVRERMERAGRDQLPRGELMDALKTIADAIRDVIGKKPG